MSKPLIFKRSCVDDDFCYTPNIQRAHDLSELNPTLVYPTHRCFDDSGEFLVGLESGHEAVHVCHGLMTCDGIVYSHAWVETQTVIGVDSAIEGCFYGGIPAWAMYVSAPAYRERRGAHSVRRYTVQEFRKFVGIFRTYGPFEELYQQHTIKKGDPAMQMTVPL